MLYNCELCKTSYKSCQSLWNHNNKFHNNVNNTVNNTVKKYKCSKCQKEFAHFQSRWRHEKTCVVNGMNIVNEIIEIKTKISQLETKPNIVNYNNTTNNTQNIIIATPPGLESIDNINSRQKKFIMNKGLSSLMYLIETTNFDKKVLENHSYCVTALNDKHASMVDTKTNSIIKTDKVDLFDKVLAGSLNKLEQFSNDDSFTSTEKMEFIDVVKRLKNVLFNEKKSIKKYYNEINLLSYNNKDLIMDTWNYLKKLDEIVMSNNFITSNNIHSTEYHYDSSDIESDDEVNSKKLAAFRKMFPVENIGSSDSESDDEVCEIIIKNITYILENNNIYTKLSNGSKGVLYGTYSNGKIKKIKK
jgi:hypothetical protein